MKNLEKATKRISGKYLANWVANFIVGQLSSEITTWQPTGHSCCLTTFMSHKRRVFSFSLEVEAMAVQTCIITRQKLAGAKKQGPALDRHALSSKPQSLLLSITSPH